MYAEVGDSLFDMITAEVNPELTDSLASYTLLYDWGHFPKKNAGLTAQEPGSR